MGRDSLTTIADNRRRSIGVGRDRRFGTRYLGIIVGMALVVGILGGWVLGSAPDFDDGAGAATQQAALPADADPAALERAALAAFKSFARLQSTSDLAYLAYYHEDAAIHLRRLLPEGGADTLDFRRGNWVGLQKHKRSAGAGREGDDGPSYSQIHTRMDGNLVIVEAKRADESENHTGPYKAAWVQASGGEWRIIEEWIEARL